MDQIKEYLNNNNDIIKNIDAVEIIGANHAAFLINNNIQICTFHWTKEQHTSSTVEWSSKSYLWGVRNHKDSVTYSESDFQKDINTNASDSHNSMNLIGNYHKWFNSTIEELRSLNRECENTENESVHHSIVTYECDHLIDEELVQPNSKFISSIIQDFSKECKFIENLLGEEDYYCCELEGIECEKDVKSGEMHITKNILISRFL
ncbi:hypothetical protein BCR36DRAFT_375837 [Piromyces finnis]|uniref:Uncharacterized protein n=1 Tax=Piromyces finnis TaxID=1754191 RepID=A0A1Y1UBT0_9FUNG|nr:hypothetical protein BCR36DRAFT_375837 [Piromyces finnis]|eukprot:ORX35500.1 hypothetical protein BCR36DRAFT_375837 [Piromyces finnis]